MQKECSRAFKTRWGMPLGLAGALARSLHAEDGIRALQAHHSPLQGQARQVVVFSFPKPQILNPKP